MKIKDNIFIRFEKKFDNSFFIFDLDKGKIYKGSEDAYKIFKLIKKYENFGEFFSYIQKHYQNDKVQRILEYLKSLNSKGIVILNNEEKKELEQKWLQSNGH